MAELWMGVSCVVAPVKCATKGVAAVQLLQGIRPIGSDNFQNMIVRMLTNTTVLWAYLGWVGGSGGPAQTSL
jgi:hypothetical protein